MMPSQELELGEADEMRGTFVANKSNTSCLLGDN